MASLPQLMQLTLSARQLAESARANNAGDFLVYLFEMAAAQADTEYSLALRKHEVQIELSRAAAHGGGLLNGECGPLSQPAHCGC